MNWCARVAGPTRFSCTKAETPTSNCRWKITRPEQISPTRDTRLRWMQSVIRCTHYVAGAGEMKYLKTDEAPEVQFVQRDEISESDCAYLPNF